MSSGSSSNGIRYGVDFRPTSLGPSRQPDSESFGYPTLVLGDGKRLELLVGEFECWCAHVMQWGDGAPDAAQLDWHVAGLSSIGLLARLVQLGPRRRLLAGGELPCAPTAVDGDGDPLE